MISISEGPCVWEWPPLIVACTKLRYGDNGCCSPVVPSLNIMASTSNKWSILIEGMIKFTNPGHVQWL